MNNNSKKLLIQCGFFTGIICAFFFILVLLMVLSRKNWEDGLKKAVWDVLPIKEYSIGKKLSLSDKNDEAICFELFHDEASSFSESMVLVMRITTYYGPLPAVFVYENGHARFAGIAYLKSSVAREFNESDKQLIFWIDKAEKIFKGIERESRGEKK